MIPLLLFFLAIGAGRIAAATNPPAPATVQTMTPPSANAHRITNNPVIIQSDGGMELDATNGVAIYRGNVRVLEVQIELACEQLIANKLTLESGTLGDVVAETNVLIVFKDRDSIKTIRGAKAVYSVTNDTVTISGNPELHWYDFTNRADLTALQLDSPKPLIDRLLASTHETHVFQRPPSMEFKTDGCFYLARQKGRFSADGKVQTTYHGQPAKSASTNSAGSAPIPGGNSAVDLPGSQPVQTNALLSTNRLPANLPEAGVTRTQAVSVTLLTTNATRTNASVALPWSTNRPVPFRAAPGLAPTNLTGPVTGRVDQSGAPATNTNAAASKPVKKKRFSVPERGLMPLRRW